LVDTLGSGSSEQYACGGSNPPFCTRISAVIKMIDYCFFY